MQHKINLFIALGLLLITGLACSFSSADLSEIKFDKDKSGNNPTANFDPADEIFAVTAVNNAVGAHKVKFRLLFDEVEGAKSGTVAYKVERDLTTDGSQKVWLNFSVPNGFVPGAYKFEAVLSDEDGKELDRKTAVFTVAGAKVSKPVKSTTPKKKETDDENPDSENNAGDEN